MSSADWEIASSKIVLASSVSARDLSSSAYLLQAYRILLSSVNFLQQSTTKHMCNSVVLHCTPLHNSSKTHAHTYKEHKEISQHWYKKPQSQTLYRYETFYGCMSYRQVMWLQPWEIKIITRHCWHRLRLFYLAKRCNMISAWYILWAWRIWNSSLLIDSRQGTLRSTHANHSQNGHFTQHIFSVWLQQLFSVWPRSTHANLKAWSRSYKGSSFRTNPFYWNEKKTKKV